MSVQLGVWIFDGKPLLPDDIQKVSSLLTSYGPDASRSYHQNGMSILWGAFLPPKKRKMKLSLMSGLRALS